MIKELRNKNRRNVMKFNASILPGVAVKRIAGLLSLIMRIPFMYILLTFDKDC